MSRISRVAAIGIMLACSAAPAMAQPYGYGAPPPPSYRPPPPYAPSPPGSRCRARFPDGQRLICPMRVSKPVGAPCRCIAPPPPGYPPEPAVHGRVIP